MGLVVDVLNVSLVWSLIHVADDVAVKIAVVIADPVHTDSPVSDVFVVAILLLYCCYIVAIVVEYITMVILLV